MNAHNDQNSPMSIEPGQHLGAYVIGDLLGQGGMGAVYRARNIHTGVDYALKVVRPDVLAEMHPEDLNRFHREAELLAQLDSEPSVVRVHSFEASALRCYYVMELVDGESLAQRVEREPLSVEDIVKIMAQAAHAMHRVHARGIVHRDLKPANILLDRDGQVRILDFGLALNPKLARLTMTGEVMGTPAFMAPEQADGAAEQRDSGAAIDVYGLGAVLYSLLVGRPPFEGRDPIRVLLQVVTAHPTAPRQLVPMLSRSLEAICLKALEKEVRDRYASAGDMADDLDRWLQGQPVHAREYSNATLRLRRFLPARGPRRKVMQVALVIAVATALLGLPLAMGGFGIWLRGDWSKSAFFDMEETTGLLKKEVNRLYSTVQDGDLTALVKRSDLKRIIAEETARHQAAIQRDTERKSILLPTSQQKLDRLDAMDRIQRRSNRWMDDKVLSDALLNDFMEPLKKIYLEPNRKTGLAALLNARPSYAKDIAFARKVVKTIDGEHPIFEKKNVVDRLDATLREDGINHPQQLPENEKLRALLRGSQLTYELSTLTHVRDIDQALETLLPALARIDADARPNLSNETRNVLVKLVEAGDRSNPLIRVNANVAILMTFPDGDSWLKKAMNYLIVDMGTLVSKSYKKRVPAEVYDKCLWLLRLGYWPLGIAYITNIAPFDDYREKLDDSERRGQPLDLHECTAWLLRLHDEREKRSKASVPNATARNAFATLETWDLIEAILKRERDARHGDVPAWAVSSVARLLWLTQLWVEKSDDDEKLAAAKRDLAGRLANFYGLQSAGTEALKSRIESLFEKSFEEYRRNKRLHRGFRIPRDYLEWRLGLQQEPPEAQLDILDAARITLENANKANDRPEGLAYGELRILTKVLSRTQQACVRRMCSDCRGPVVDGPGCEPSIEQLIALMTPLAPEKNHWRATRMAHLLIHDQEELAMTFWPKNTRKNTTKNGPFWKAYLELTLQLLDAGRKAKAERALTLSLELRPKDEWDLIPRAGFWDAVGRNDMAKKDREAANQLMRSEESRN